MNTYIYNNHTQCFSIGNEVITGPWNFKLDYNYTGILAKAIMPQVATSSYKFHGFVPIDRLRGDQKISAQKVWDNLVKKYDKECPILMSTTFNNACHAHGIDQLIKSVPEDQRDYAIKEFCRSFGLDEAEFIRKLGPHMIFIGPKYVSPEVLAHELGHYLNTIDKGLPGGAKAHRRYGKAKSIDRKVNWVTNLLLVALGFVPSMLRPWGFGIYAIGQLSRLLITRPIIKSEKLASLTGLELLQIAGATPEELTMYATYLNEAYGTYKLSFVYRPLVHAGLGALGTLATGMPIGGVGTGDVKVDDMIKGSN